MKNALATMLVLCLGSSAFGGPVFINGSLVVSSAPFFLPIAISREISKAAAENPATMKNAQIEAQTYLSSYYNGESVQLDDYETLNSVVEEIREKENNENQLTQLEMIEAIATAVL